MSSPGGFGMRSIFLLSRGRIGASGPPAGDDFDGGIAPAGGCLSIFGGMRMQCPACRKYLTPYDFRAVNRKRKRYAALCRACELRAQLDAELREQDRRRDEYARLAREARLSVTPDD